jgi:hypothetical protein
MGRGRGREAILAGLGIAAAGLIAAGCGAETHANDPRPPIAAGVSVNITGRAVQAQPAAVGVKHANAGVGRTTVSEPSANPKAPQVVIFTTSNTTTTETTLEIHGPGGLLKRSGPIVGEGNNRLKAGLPSGHYTLEAGRLPGAKPASFYVGPARVSSENDLLLP